MKSIKIREIFDPARTLSVTVPETETLENVIVKFAADARLRGVFLMDSKKRFAGVITRSDLLRWAALKLRRGHDIEELTAGHILTLVTATRARDLAKGDWLTLGVKLEDDLGKALDQMLENDEIDIPVIDDEGRILGDIKISEVLLKAVQVGRDRS